MFFCYSGPGSQRYPVGFSGDTVITWESLDFQPYFTATTFNIGYSWWSREIGGHMWGYRDDELITRWIQLGVFSPINRLHSSNSCFIRKEPWCFEEKTENIIKNWLRLRHRLFLYIYTMNYRTHTELEPLVQPMYYTYPKNSAAYEVKNQIFFGSEQKHYSKIKMNAYFQYQYFNLLYIQFILALKDGMISSKLVSLPLNPSPCPKFSYITLYSARFCEKMNFCEKIARKK